MTINQSSVENLLGMMSWRVPKTPTTAKSRQYASLRDGVNPYPNTEAKTKMKY